MLISVSAIPYGNSSRHDGPWSLPLGIRVLRSTDCEKRSGGFLLLYCCSYYYEDVQRAAAVTFTALCLPCPTALRLLGYLTLMLSVLRVRVLDTHVPYLWKPSMVQSATMPLHPSSTVSPNL